MAIGEVWLMGDIVPGEYGWRASKAYPKSVIVPHECWRVVKSLRDYYGVPVSLGNILEREGGK